MDLSSALALFTTKGELPPSDDTWRINQFPDGQIQFAIKSSYLMNDAFWMVGCLRSAEAVDLFMQARMVLERANRLSFAAVTYLYGGRSDKWTADPWILCPTAHYTMSLLAGEIGLGREETKIKILDPHHIKGPSTLASHGLCGVKIEDYDLVIFPDQSAAERFRGTSTDALPSIVCAKHRDQESGRITGHVVPKVDISSARILVADDICDGGATFISLIDQLMEGYNPSIKLNIDLYTTHSIYSNGAVERLLDAGYRKLLTTNSYHRHLRSTDDLQVTNVWVPQTTQDQSWTC